MNKFADKIGPKLSRLLAFSLLFFLLWSAVAHMAVPAYEAFAQVKQEINQKRIHLGRIEGAIAFERQTLNDLNVEFENQKWIGKSAPIISAELQGFVQQTAQKNTVRILSITPMRTRPYSEFDTIGLRIELEGGIKAVRDVISELENHQPFIFLNAVDMRPQQSFRGNNGQAWQSLPLVSRLDVYVPIGVAQGS